MYRLFAYAVLLLICEASIFYDNSPKKGRCWTSGNGFSARWWDEGERIDRGKYWYKCERGNLKPEGCFSDKGKRLRIGERYVQNGYEMQCVLDHANDLQFKFTACLSVEGQTYEVGQTWEDDQHMYWFACEPDGTYLRVQIKGCVTHDKSRRIKLDEKYDKDEYTYQCLKKYNGTVQMCSVGCIHKGNHYKIGDQWPDGDYIYYCKLKNGRCQKICVGCQYNDKSLYDGDRYRKGGTVFECEVRTDKFGHRPVGCVVQDKSGQTVERIVGCVWSYEKGNSKVEQTCKVENGKTVVKTVGCIFVHKGYDTLFLKPNTFTIWNKLVEEKGLGVLCKDNGGDGLPSLETFKIEQLAEKTIGLKYDLPQGK